MVIRMHLACASAAKNTGASGAGWSA
eukprot:SAG11_NODE_12625_length_694_cov_0.878992_1_plen_25_part_10